MTRPVLLDLFCGAGGAAVGYHRAGFDVIGVDIEPQPRYPYRFIRADATAIDWRNFDAVHASPPCTDHTELFRRQRGDDSAWMLTATLERFADLDVPWVIENVPGARRTMGDAFTLCGRSFGIAELKRHRLFRSNVFMLAPPCACDGTSPIGVYGHLARNDRAMHGPTDPHRGVKAGVDTARRLLGCDWMTGPELSLAIPPAYTEYIGGQLLAAMG